MQPSGTCPGEQRQDGAERQVGRRDERRHRNREDVKVAGRKRVQEGTNGKREGDRMSRKKHRVIGAGEGEGKKGDIF